MRKTDEMMDNPLVLSGLIKDVVGNIFLTNEDLTNLVMPVLDDDDYSYEDNWFGCRIKKLEWTVKRRIARWSLQGYTLYGRNNYRCKINDFNGNICKYQFIYS